MRTNMVCCMHMWTCSCAGARRCLPRTCARTWCAACTCGHAHAQVHAAVSLAHAHEHGVLHAHVDMLMRRCTPLSPSHMRTNMVCCMHMWTCSCAGARRCLPRT